MGNRALLKAWAKGAKLGETSVWHKIRTWDITDGRVTLVSSWPIHELPHSIDIVCPGTEADGVAWDEFEKENDLELF